MAGKIFISYRRGDDPGNTGRLFDHLQQAFQPEQLFMDVDSIAPGLDFVRVLEEQVGQCDVMLAMIGPRWFDAVDQHGSRRIDDPNDFVRIEIESALKQDKRVIPVLVGETRMPRLEDLPEAIRLLARRNAVRLTHERFRADAHSLVKALQQALDEAEALRQARVEAARRAQTEAERRREEEAANERAKVQREAEEHARREKEQARLTAIAGLSADKIDKAEELANWDFIKASESAQEFRDHLARFPHGVTERMARTRLESLMWAGLSVRPDLSGLRSFLDQFPDARHAADAKARLAALERQSPAAREEEERGSQEMAAWVSASTIGDAAALKAFLTNWPRSQHAKAARTQIREIEGGSMWWEWLPQRLRAPSGTLLGLSFFILMTTLSISYVALTSFGIPRIAMVIVMGIAALLPYWRRATVGGTELALYWLGCVLAMAIVIYEWMTLWSPEFLLNIELMFGLEIKPSFELISASALVAILLVAVCSAAVLAYRRRAVLGGVELALYWLGCSTLIWLAIGNLFQVAQPNDKGSFSNGYLIGALIVTCVAAVLAYWRRAALSRSELWIYSLAIATFVLFGFVAGG
jgi:hypothetical protein